MVVRGPAKRSKGEFATAGQYLAVRPGTVIEKEFRLAIDPAPLRGAAFRRPVHRALELYAPFSCEGLPGFEEIVAAKCLMTRSRWIDEGPVAGFNMYPAPRRAIVMGWCGQAAAPGYFLQHLGALGVDTVGMHAMVQRSLDFLTRAPFDGEGFCVPIRCRFAMLVVADPVFDGAGDVQFRAGDPHRPAGRAATIRPDGRPSWRRAWRLRRTAGSPIRPGIRGRTAEAFFIAPLLAAADFSAASVMPLPRRVPPTIMPHGHLSMDEPYWGGHARRVGRGQGGGVGRFSGVSGALRAYARCRVAGGVRNMPPMSV